AAATPTRAHGFRLTDSATAIAGAVDPAATAPLADVGETVAAALDAAAVVPGIAEVPATGIPALLTGMPGSATAATGLRLESVSLFRRCSSARISEACWYRNSRSFSSARLMIRSSSGGKSGFSRTGAAGERLRIASKIVAVLSPRNGNAPVAIS